MIALKIALTLVAISAVLIGAFYALTSWESDRWWWPMAAITGYLVIVATSSVALTLAWQ